MFARILLLALVAELAVSAASADEACGEFSMANACSLAGKCGQSPGESSGHLAGAALGCAMILGSAWMRRRRGA